MYPCLFVSPYEEPHIVVHREFDGTACKIESGLHQNTQIGKCRSGVCTRESAAKVLKRKKRFICLLTLAQLIKARRDRRKLRGDLEQLKKYVLLSNYAHAGRLGIGGEGTGNLQGGRIHGVESQGHNANGPSDLEIHIVTPGGHGAAVPVSSVGITRPSNSENNFNNGVGGLNAPRTVFSNEGTGRAGHVDANLASVNIAEPSSTRTTSGVAGIGESIPVIGEVGNAGDGSNGAYARINRFSAGTASTFGRGAGGRGLSLGSRFGGSSAGNGFGSESEDATVPGDGGLGPRYHGSVIRGNGRRVG